MPKPRPPHLVNKLLNMAKLYGMYVLVMANALEYAVPMERKSLLITTKAHLPSYKDLYFLNPKPVNLLKVHLHGCLNNTLTALIGIVTLKLQRNKKNTFL